MPKLNVCVYASDTWNIQSYVSICTCKKIYSNTSNTKLFDIRTYNVIY